MALTSRVHSGDPQALAAADWRRSGISDEVAQKLKFTPLSAEETRSLGETFQPVPALFIPYFDLEGERTEFYRVRYLAAPPGFWGAVARPQRYAQAPGTVPEIYLPPLLAEQWSHIATDPDAAIYITEGEKKAAAAALHGFNCLGLGGVDSWRATKRGFDILPALAQITWERRRVYIVFDSDAATNPNVVRAQRQLAQELIERGAFVHVISLPSAGEKKQGLDDYLLAEGEAGLDSLVDQVIPYPEASSLWELSEEIAYIRDPGLILVQESGQRLSPHNFITHAYANRHYKETINGAFKKRLLAKRWLEWEQRFTLDTLTYQPGEQKIYQNSWNTWKGWGVEPKAGEMAPWHWLLGFLFQDAPENKIWFERWLAYPLQYPGAKLYTASVLWGAHQGTGKTLAAYAMMKIYGQNAVEIKNRDLRGNFNSWAEAKQFVYGDEITGGDKRVDADWLKGLITQDRIMINMKYTPEYTLPDCVNYLFTSNHPDAFFLEDDDRRFFIHEVAQAAAEARFYDACDKWLHGVGPSALFHYLLSLNLGDFNPHAQAPPTAAKREMNLHSKGDLASWVAELAVDPVRLLKPLGEKAAEQCDLFTAEQMRFCYDRDRETRVTSNGIGRELKRAKYHAVKQGDPVQTATGRYRLYMIRNREKWANASYVDIQKHFDQFFGLPVEPKTKF